MRYLLIILAISVSLFSACQSSGQLETHPAKLKRYKLTGNVIAVDRAGKKASIKHNEIPGYMGTMTMDFPIREDEVLDELVRDSEVKAELVVDNINGDYWLEKVIVTSPAKPGQAPLPVIENVAKAGKTVVDFTLINQNNKKISAKDFKGKGMGDNLYLFQMPFANFLYSDVKEFFGSCESTL